MLVKLPSSAKWLENLFPSPAFHAVTCSAMIVRMRASSAARLDCVRHWMSEDRSGDPKGTFVELCSNLRDRRDLQNHVQLSHSGAREEKA